MIKNQKQMFVVIGIFVLTLLLGSVTFAFFNYTRTGTANNIKTGKIYFNADEGNNTVTLSDLFPISVGENEEITANTPGVGSLKLHITGDTTYSEGIEYLIEAVEVIGNGNTSLPISINISYAATSVEQGQDPNVIGTNDEEYFTNRGGNTPRYKLLSEGSISEGEDILVGYIAPGTTGIDGELTILAYLDAKNIAITDTYDEDEPETSLNGTTTNWVNERTVFTTEEWNALQATGVSFKVKVTANEGTWVEVPTSAVPTMDEMCPGCKFMYNTIEWTFGDDSSIPPTTSGVMLADDYTLLNKNVFLGYTELDGKIDRVFLCGIKRENPNNGVPFCAEGALDNSKYYNNQLFLNSSPGGIWNGTCTFNNSSFECNGSTSIVVYENGKVEGSNEGDSCYIDYFDELGVIGCY